MRLQHAWPDHFYLFKKDHEDDDGSPEPCECAQRIRPIDAAHERQVEGRVQAYGDGETQNDGNGFREATPIESKAQECADGS